MLRAYPMPSPPLTWQLSLSQSAADICRSTGLVSISNQFFVHWQEASVVQWLEWRILGQGSASSPPPCHVLFSAFEQGGRGGWLAGRYKRKRPGQAGRYKIFLMWGGGGILASLPGQEGTYWSYHTFITHEILSPCQHFCASQDTHSISLAVNNTCPRAHLHSWSNQTVIPLNGITVLKKVYFNLSLIVSKSGKTGPRDKRRWRMFKKLQ